ncbi:MAG: sulfatase [Bacteroidota bacterium]
MKATDFSNNTRRNDSFFIRKTLVSLFIVLLVKQTVLSQNLNSGKPNVLFILVDDLNDWVGCLNGHPNALTPNIDRLANEGLLFTNAHCDAPICCPSRTSLISGVAPYKTGVYQNNDHWQDAEVLDNINDMPRHFQQNGYKTLGVGKLYHHKSWPEDWETTFDEYGGRLGAHNLRLYSPEYTYPWEGIKGSSNFAFHWGPIDYPEAEQLSDIKLASWAVERLNQKHSKPFYLMVGFHSPHIPFTSPREFHERFKNEEVLLPAFKENDADDMPLLGRQFAFAGRADMQNGIYKQVKERGLHQEIVKNYLAAVTYVDAQIGKVLDALENSPYKKNTMIILTSDHGWSLGQQTHFKKFALWESVTRVPFIVYLPAMKDKGVKTNAGVTLMDIYPTLVDYCQLPDPGHQLDGKSLRPLLDNPGTTWERAAVTTLGQNNRAVCNGRWKYIRYMDGSEELYDLVNDPHEWYNVAGLPRHEDVKDKLARYLSENDVPAVSSDNALPVKLKPEEPSKDFVMMTNKFIGKPISIKADINSREGNGIIVTLESYFAGFSLYVADDKLLFSVMDVPVPLKWNTLYPERTIIESSKPLPKGKLKIETRLSEDGQVTMYANGEKIGEGQAKTLSLHPAGVMTLGNRIENYEPAGYYPSNFGYPVKFEGDIEEVIVDNK